MAVYRTFPGAQGGPSTVSSDINNQQSFGSSNNDIASAAGKSLGDLVKAYQKSQKISANFQSAGVGASGAAGASAGASGEFAVPATSEIGVESGAGAGAGGAAAGAGTALLVLAILNAVYQTAKESQYKRDLLGPAKTNEIDWTSPYYRSSAEPNTSEPH